ncbi:B-cell receptor CD22 [Orchesella cincta]|uniref:B-cell receptor CD22 n=1 Tax=Orchesella cincta TaxID=48709 RepID=A0A1D2NHH8_ORCCI|nr:B-cell receptor CD22 [Orchesella cincta]
MDSKLKLGEGKREGKELPIRIDVPPYVREGDTAILRCQYDLDDDKLYTMKWYKGAQEFFRFTPKESPPIKTFPLFGLEVDPILSNSSVLALANVDLNMTGRYSCEVTKDYPDYTTGVKTCQMNVIVSRQPH